MQTRISVILGLLVISILVQVVLITAQELSPEKLEEGRGRFRSESQWNSPVNPNLIQNGQRHLAKRSLVLLDEDSDDDEDQECPTGQYWHIRGRRCVPFRCRGGNQYRDSATGQCIIGLFKNVPSINAHRPRTIW